MKLAILAKGCVREESTENNLIDQMKLKGIKRAHSLEEADYLLYITCAGVGDTINKIINELYKITTVINGGYTHAKLIVTGCLANVFDLDEFLSRYLDRDKFIVIKNKDFVVPVFNYLLDDNKRNTTKTRLANRTNHFFSSPVIGQFFIADGCLNRCTFCKTNYNHSKVESVPLEVATAHIRNLVNNGLKKIIISADNTCLYGIDLYNKRMLHILLKEISKLDLDIIILNEITINNMYPELLEEILSNPKIKCVGLQLESASDRLLKLMGRGHTIKEYDIVAKELINSGKHIDTILMSGFPTEEYSDLDATAQYVNERGIIVSSICEYSDFYLIPSHKLEQLSKSEKRKHTKYLKDRINNLQIYSSLDFHDFILVQHSDGLSIFTCDIPMTVISYNKKYSTLPIGTHINANIKRLVKTNKYNKEVAYLI